MYAAIDSVLQGKIYLCSEIQNNLAQHLFEDEEDKLSTLTERELEIVKLIKKGLTSQEISDQLFLSIRTVDTHRSRILKKLGLKNTAGLINLVTNSYLDL
jgi:DNA-binding NarL/FixJ family response regulator